MKDNKIDKEIDKDEFNELVKVNEGCQTNKEKK